ncbi:hypothetical protein F4805DRAFT_460055 [Annulohypoxylon moriforme]|nr:hypothetical protein F4805DRAFT_460055 [Annulohypoxylon moriforme]
MYSSTGVSSTGITGPSTESQYIMSQHESRVSGANSYIGGKMNQGGSEKKEKLSKDKSKYMYMERRKGSKMASIVYDPNYRPGRKISSKNKHQSSPHLFDNGDMGPTAQAHPMKPMAPKQPDGIPHPKPAGPRSQYADGDPRAERQPTGKPCSACGEHRGGRHPAEPTTESYTPSPHSRGAFPPGNSSRIMEEEISMITYQHGVRRGRSISSGPAIRGGLGPDDSASQRARTPGPSGNSGTKVATGCGGRFQLSWVEKKPGGKKYLFQGVQPQRPRN